MDVSPLLDQLNESQRQAVSLPDDANALILAGAGSGKTRVLVQRMAWLMSMRHCSSSRLLAVTFTNKSAREMRTRIENLLSAPLHGMWVGTFHGLGHRLLRQHWQEANLPQNFQILDSDDQLRIIRRLIKAAKLDESRWPPRQVQWFINARKDAMQRSTDLSNEGDDTVEQMIRIYRQYEIECQKSGLLDFADLLFRSYQLLKNNDTIRTLYQSRFAHIMVDEFQDTNPVQYAWLKLLTGEHTSVFVVGDDDQSIYGWRGACVENIQHFERDFHPVHTVRLEQNYRSTNTILNAANALIANNQQRLGKNLWSDSGEGDLLRYYRATNELEEAGFVVDRILQHQQQGLKYEQMAILYRSNAQSRVFEENLIARRVPYRVYGGLRFFERAEIKDALSYLRLLINPQDNAAFERIINNPTRGIGQRTLDSIRNQAKMSDSSLWDAALFCVEQQTFAARAHKALQGFLQMMDRLRQHVAEKTLPDAVETLLHETGLWALYKKQLTETAQAKLENLAELVSAARQFEIEEGGLISGDEGVSEILNAFLSHAVLEAGEGQADTWDDCVQLMSLHAAKGLEFPLVFITGMEEGLFPGHRSISEPAKLEEERRLCYVGMTRAEQWLYLCCAERRRLYGNEFYARPSRFIQEVPENLIESVRLTGSVRRPITRQKTVTNSSASTQGFSSGQRVSHQKFGEGTILNAEGSGNSQRLHINFANVGNKWLMASLANLQFLP